MVGGRPTAELKEGKLNNFIELSKVERDDNGTDQPHEGQGKSK